MATQRDEILRVLEEVVAPLVASDGGKIYLVKADEDAVVVHLGGRFSGCPGNTLAQRRVIEPAILAVAPGTQVIVTSGARVPADAEPLPRV
jgi:Fe-S cluster biogenesis protein NfuA